MGIPTVGLVGDPFIEDANASSLMEGLRQREVVVEHPFTDTGEAARKKAKSVMDKIIQGLTQPLTAEEKRTGVVEPPRPPTVAVQGSLEEVQEYFSKRYWTDGLPIIPPTEEAVKKMLTGTSHKPAEVIGLMPPENWRATVEGVAINGVMAGCKPEDMPVLLAMVEAFMKERLFVSTVRSTTSFSFMVLVNGPITKKIGMNADLGALGAGPFANSAIGRALRLFIINLGGSKIGVNDMGATGNVTRFTFCIAENEGKSPWEPYHVSKGFKPEESTVTVFTGGWYVLGPGTLATVDPDIHLRNLIKELKAIQYPKDPVIVMTPLLAKKFAEKGFSRKSLQKYLWENTTITFGDWWKLEWISGFIEKQIGIYYPKWYADRTIPPERIVPMVRSS
ncbi:MAG: hypothetical protein A4E57_02795 [Syntrophorhabdaceae bacterium PtaU1.Bin034]|nr:MAG: hypothetical protein A4E57_02795 [Syntrophorhabdaceae bacterium PtaU1.Bin034]